MLNSSCTHNTFNKGSASLTSSWCVEFNRVLIVFSSTSVVMYSSSAKQFQRNKIISSALPLVSLSASWRNPFVIMETQSHNIFRTVFWKSWTCREANCRLWSRIVEKNFRVNTKFSQAKSPFVTETVDQLFTKIVAMFSVTFCASLVK